jgi:hypothetical protein
MAGASAGAEGSDAAAEAVVALLPESMSVVLVLENKQTNQPSKQSVSVRRALGGRLPWRCACARH